MYEAVQEAPQRVSPALHLWQGPENILDSLLSPHLHDSLCFTAMTLLLHMSIKQDNKHKGFIQMYLVNVDMFF